MKRVDYDRQQYAVYARARALSPTAVAQWIAAFARHAPVHRPLTVLDLGSGTGRFTPALADAFGGPVYGVEPAARMRAIAEESARHPAVTYLAGRAERIPLPDASCDLVLLYLVLQHVEDRPAAAAEMARILRPGGRLLLRNPFADRLPDLLWYRYFPRARVVEAEMFPTLGEATATFAAAGLQQVALDVVPHRFADSLAEYADRLRLRGYSTFEHLTEEDIEGGLAALDAAVAAEGEPQPVVEDCDLLVLAKSAQDIARA